MARLKLNPGLRMVEFAAGRVQFGLGAGGLVLEGTEETDRRFLRRLRQGFESAELDAVRTDCGLTAERAAMLLAALAPVLVPDSGGERLSGLRADRLAPDARHWSAVYSADSEGSLAARSRCVVQIIGLGRTGAALATALTAAGVGTLLLEDPAVVGPADVGSGAFRITDIGLTRGQAVRRAARQIDPTVACHLLPGSTAEQGAAGIFPRALNLAIYLDRDVADPRVSAALLSRGHPHLSVLVREHDTLIGPLVVPGHTSCLGCVELHRTDADPAWPEVVARLTGTPVKAAGRISADEVSQSVAAAGLAAHQALLFLDGRNQPGSFSAVLKLESGDGTVTRHAYPPHPGCGCVLAAAS
ncbi:TOMM precursor leader peptide-binding protein [Arthrobacter sp. CAU 1506]|uniref:TOMM precursor leader peptide-binding protein n=1 Tax=Arthrobacter sp. CAU 1506 TaxID=2560052 RepID=UPI0010AC4DDA|nr:TOMM precursor leader peptide-binding protein [Arthrobacter sp. CAU 1506]TJY71301.1 TOMM precursor leader peptide-binding protein [Arthrobacter sp. CAU 1506]